MKKLIMCAVCILIGAAAAAAVLLFICGFRPQSTAAVKNGEQYEAETTNSENLDHLAFDVLDCIKNRDYSAMSSYAHPDSGVVFSPYSTVSLNSNQRFSKADIASFDKNTDEYIWGVYDGQDEPIRLTVEEYFDRFVFDHDYSCASAVAINYIIRSGNSLENVMTVFPDCQFVDFYVPSPATDPEDVDWHILRLVFDTCGDEMKLIAVINSRYTV